MIAVDEIYDGRPPSGITVHAVILAWPSRVARVRPVARSHILSVWSHDAEIMWLLSEVTAHAVTLAA